MSKALARRRVSRLITIGSITLLVLVAWSGLVVVATLNGWGRRPHAREHPYPFMRAPLRRLADPTGNLAHVQLEDGRVLGEHFASRGRPVGRDTRFQVASLSKWITAWGVMTLVQSGRLNLDAPVDTYLTRWRLPPGDFDNREVTVRRLLSHTAGLTDGLGYLGFAPGRPVQTLEASLTRAADAAPGAGGSVRVGSEPGSGWRYSGGGYALLQLVIEEVTGEPFAAYMQRAVLAPLGMSGSTYQPAGADGLATLYDADGSEAPRYRYTATGAASLYTSAADLTRFIQAHLPGPGGEPPGRGVLSPLLLESMRRPHAARFADDGWSLGLLLSGVDAWGLGLILYAPNRAGGFIVGHDGGNAPAINTAARFDPATGDGIIVLETGDPSLASRLGGEWVFWKTGEAGLPIGRIARRIAVGSILILLIGTVIAWRTRHRPLAR